MKKHVHSLTALLLAGVFLFSACSQGGSTSQPAQEAAPKSTAASTQESSKAEAPPEDTGNLNKTGLPILKEKETFVIMVQKSGLSKNTYPEKEPVQMMEAETNIAVTWQEIAASGWKEKVNLSFASNDLPDAFISGIGAATVMQNIDSLVPIGDYVDEYAPAIKAYWESRPDIKAALTTPDGKIYAFNTSEESPWTVTDSIMLINKTWLDDLGMTAPKTTDEFYTVMKAFKDNDMNKNGKADEVPFSFCQQDVGYKLNSFFGAFGVLDNKDHLMVENGKVVFPAVTDEFRQALEWFHTLSSEGLMDIEGFSQTLEQLQAKGKNADVLLGSFISYNADTATGDNSPNYTPLEPISSGNGKPVLWNRETQSGGNITGFVVTTACENPEALVRWHDHINSSWENKMLWGFGPEGTSWKFNDAGMWIQNDDNVPQGASWGEYRQTVAPGPNGNWFMTPEDVVYKRSLAARTQARLDAITNHYQQYFPAERLQTFFEDAEVANEKNLLLVEIDAYLLNFIANSVLKGVTDDQWATHLKTCESLNIARYVELWQTYYDSLAA
ncbi:extracellular solute-binding protein [Ruminococcaceae bacterium OttesenSCG-928-L11]|nr:extracellular solute-binding protein [Ruminococcaceae bacterium OttesenSCG-928-L11]